LTSAAPAADFDRHVMARCAHGLLPSVPAGAPEESIAMIRTIHIQGFKSIADQEFELGRLNCLIGANGVGKSNVLEAVGILGAAANGRVDDEAIVRRGVRPGLPRLYKTAFEAGRIRPHITLQARSADGAVFRVTLLNPLERPEPAWSFKTEFLSDGTSELVSRGVSGGKGNLAPTAGLSALKLVELPSTSVAAVLLQALQAYAIYNPNTPALRATVQDPQMRPPLGLSGGGLAEAFQNLRETLGDDDERLDQIFSLIDWVRDISATDAASSLLSPSVARGKNILKFTDRFMKDKRNTLTAYDASEGALYVLFAAVLCLSASAPRLLAVDNLDQALNPRLVARLTEKLSGWLASTNPERQLVFTAHNPAVLDGLDLTDDEVRLFAVERNNLGHTCVRRVTLSDELRKLNQEYPLSRLWMMGNLGAVPNV
jgi:predicted ATPase